MVVLSWQVLHLQWRRFNCFEGRRSPDTKLRRCVLSKPELSVMLERQLEQVEDETRAVGSRVLPISDITSGAKSKLLSLRKGWENP
jgi:hypothetical protein